MPPSRAALPPPLLPGAAPSFSGGERRPLLLQRRAPPHFSLAQCPLLPGAGPLSLASPPFPWRSPVLPGGSIRSDPFFLAPVGAGEERRVLVDGEARRAAQAAELR
jgi:hypothetical protein